MLLYNEENDRQDLIYKLFHDSPLPMSLTKIDDGEILLINKKLIDQYIETDFIKLNQIFSNLSSAP